MDAARELVGELTPVTVVALLAAADHAYEGRPSDGPRGDSRLGSHDRIVVRAGLGIEGDRYFNQRAHRNASVTVFDAGSLDLVAPGLDPLLTRRNIVLRGFPVDALAARRGEPGAVFSIDTGDGPVRFQARRPANPCAWMNVVLGAGAMRALRGRGGVRCTPLDDGELSVGPGVLRLLP